MSGAPDPKSRSLERPRKRYRRKVASRKQWEKIVAEKGGPCRACTDPATNGHGLPVIHFHHVVSRENGGDDTADNIVPLCQMHHDAVTRRHHASGLLLIVGLSDAEYAYMIERGGGDYPERAYGVRYER